MLQFYNSYLSKRQKSENERDLFCFVLTTRDLSLKSCPTTIEKEYAFLILLHLSDREIRQSGSWYQLINGHYQNISTNTQVRKELFHLHSYILNYSYNFRHLNNIQLSKSESMLFWTEYAVLVCLNYATNNFNKHDEPPGRLAWTTPDSRQYTQHPLLLPAHNTRKQIHASKKGAPSGPEIVRNLWKRVAGMVGLRHPNVNRDPWLGKTFSSSWTLQKFKAQSQ
jgi:hypothetical protein